MLPSSTAKQELLRRPERMAKDRKHKCAVGTELRVAISYGIEPVLYVWLCLHESAPQADSRMFVPFFLGPCFKEPRRVRTRHERMILAGLVIFFLPSPHLVVHLVSTNRKNKTERNNIWKKIYQNHQNHSHSHGAFPLFLSRSNGSFSVTNGCRTPTWPNLFLVQQVCQALISFTFRTRLKKTRSCSKPIFFCPTHFSSQAYSSPTDLLLSSVSASTNQMLRMIASLSRCPFSSVLLTVRLHG